MVGNEWTIFVERAVAMAPACYFHAKIISTSRISKIRNSDVLRLFAAGAFFAAYWAIRGGGVSIHVAAVNSAFLFLVAFAAYRFSWPAYVKYFLASGVPFVLGASVARFAALAILAVFVTQAFSALAFYVRTSVSWGLFGFLRKHFSDASGRNSGFSATSVFRHAFAFLVMVAAVRFAQHLLSSDYALPHLWLTAEEFSLAMTAVGMFASWSVFSLKDRILAWPTAVVAFLVLSAVMVRFVTEVGVVDAADMLVRALAMYGFVWAVRGVLAFHSVCDGAQYVPYDQVRPGDMVDGKFLFRFLADFQYDEAAAKDIVRDASGWATEEWIAKLRTHVDAATRSAVERGLRGFKARREILVLRKSVLVPHFAFAAMACLASFPDSPVRFFR